MLHRFASLAALLGACAFAVPAHAQSGGPDSFGYQYFTTPHEFVPLLTTGGATPTGISGSGEEVVTLPFPFSFYGNTYTEVAISAEGALTFTTSASVQPGNSCFPALASGSPDIAIFWDDLNPLNGEIRTWYDSAEGRFIISWEGVAHAPNNGAASFQIHLYELGGDIEFHYADVDFGNAVSNFGVSATVGIQDNIGGTILQGNFLEWFCDSSQLSDGLSMKFSSCADADGDGVTDAACGGLDCDDTDPASNPDAPEACDGADNDCDGVITDENADEDSDGQTPCDGDCDDTEPTVLTGGTEVCDGLDNDCISGVDDPFDGDGDGVATCVGDCDDTDPNIYPGAVEICDGEDSDCDGATFDSYQTPDASFFTTATDFFRGTMFAPTESTFLDSISAFIDPDASFSSPRDVAWLVFEGPDQNGEMVKIAEVAQQIPSSGQGWYESPQIAVTMQPGLHYAVGIWWSGTVGYGYNTSPGFPADVGWGENIGGASSGPWGAPPASSVTLATSTSYDIIVSTGGEEDFDQDGALACEDCDDADGTSYGGATEVCDGQDNDCDGTVPVTEADVDGDGYIGCQDDCDDDNADSWPGNPDGEACDGSDNDCDGALGDDEVDSDGDGSLACDDCDDGNDAMYPGGTEVCDGLDNDCDNITPADESDFDSDGARPCNGDCNDLSSAAHPDNTVEDFCSDNVDNDCDGDVDEDDDDCPDDNFDDDDATGGDDDDSTGGGGGGGGCKNSVAGGDGSGAWLLVGLLAIGIRRRR